LFGPPIVVKGTLYFGAGDGYVYAVNPERGTLRWRTRLDAPVLAGVAFAANLVCAATAGGRVAGLDPEGGKIVWSVTPAAAMYQARPATDGRRLFLGDWSNNFLALDAATGQPLWKVTIGKSFYYSAAIGFPALNADSSLVYVSSDDGVLHAIETKTGAERWQVNGPALGYSGPLFQSGRIYNASLTDTGHVFCFDAASGEKRWDTETGSVIYDSSCCAAGGDVCVGCVDGTLAALHAADGSLDWEYRLGAGHLLSSPVADAERIYIGSESGRFFAFPVRKAP
jgi:outer membrane protein assembly factor BamB